MLACAPGAFIAKQRTVSSAAAFLTGNVVSKSITLPNLVVSALLLAAPAYAQTLQQIVVVGTTPVPGNVQSLGGERLAVY